MWAVGVNIKVHPDQEWLIDLIEDFGEKDYFVCKWDNRFIWWYDPTSGWTRSLKSERKKWWQFRMNWLTDNEVRQIRWVEEAKGYITAINECTVEADIPVDSFATKYAGWRKAKAVATLQEALKMYLYMFNLTTRTLRDHVAWKEDKKTNPKY